MGWRAYRRTDMLGILYGGRKVGAGPPMDGVFTARPAGPTYPSAVHTEEHLAAGDGAGRGHLWSRPVPADGFGSGEGEGDGSWREG